MATKTARINTKEIVTKGIATNWTRNDGATTRGASTFSVCVSLTEISTRLGFVAGLAMLALLVIGWRKPARNFPASPRDHSRDSTSEGRLLDESNPVNAPVPEITETIARKVLDATGLGAIALVGGVVAAIVIATTLSFVVTNVISRL